MPAKLVREDDEQDSKQEITIILGLEQRILDALNGNDATAAALAELIEQTDAAIADAADCAVQERKNALSLDSDPVKAAQAIATAELMRDRLRNVLPQLEAKYSAVAGKEVYSAWVAKEDAYVARRDAMADKLEAVYMEFAIKLLETLTEAKQIDAEGRQIASAKPGHLPQAFSDGRYFKTVEQVARGLANISPEFSIYQLKIPAWNANQLVHPIVDNSMALAFAAVPVPGDPRLYTDRWHEAHEDRAKAEREKQLREEQMRQAEIDARPKPYLGPVRLGAQ